MSGNSQDWQWIEPYRSIGFCITLAEGLTPSRMLEAYGVDSHQATVLDIEGMTDWLDGEELDESAPVVRAGQVGSCAFAFESVTFEGGRSPVLRRISDGGRAASFLWMPGELSFFAYYVDGEFVTGFEGPASRQGSDPDRLLGPMRCVGLDPVEGVDATQLDSVVAALRLMQIEFGVYVSGEAVDGPLLTGLVEQPWHEDPIAPRAAPMGPRATPMPPAPAAERRLTGPAGPSTDFLAPS
jgi:hypothetical protein